MTIETIIDAQDWDNYTNEQEDAEGNPTGKPEYWDVCQVLYCKLDHLTQSLAELAEENGDDFNELTDHLDTIGHIQSILGLLDEEKLKSLEQKCAHCGEPLYTIVRAHHHTEDGKDVTS